MESLYKEVLAKRHTKPHDKIRTGLPPTTTPEGTGFVTTESAAINAPSPKLTPINLAYFSGDINNFTISFLKFNMIFIIIIL